MYFFLEFLPLSNRLNIGAILKNASSFSNARAQRSGARSLADGRKTVAGMTAISLALAGLTVPAVGGDLAQAQELCNTKADGSPIQMLSVGQAKSEGGNWFYSATVSGKVSSLSLVFPSEDEEPTNEGRSFPDNPTFEVRNGLQSLTTAKGEATVNPDGTTTLNVVLDQPQTFNANMVFSLRAEGKGKQYPLGDGSGFQLNQSSFNTVENCPVEKASVSGNVVTTRSSQEPISAATVKLIDGSVSKTDVRSEVSLQTATVRNESFRFDEVEPERSYTVGVVPPPGFVTPDVQNWTPAAGEARTLPDFQLTPITVTGTVRDKNDQPVVGRTVSIGGKTGVTDASGKFEISEVPAGPGQTLNFKGDDKYNEGAWGVQEVRDQSVNDLGTFVLTEKETPTSVVVTTPPTSIVYTEAPTPTKVVETTPPTKTVNSQAPTPTKVVETTPPTKTVNSQAPTPTKVVETTPPTKTVNSQAPTPTKVVETTPPTKTVYKEAPTPVSTITTTPEAITTTVQLPTPVTTVTKAPTTTVIADPTTVTPTVPATDKPSNTAAPTTTPGDYSDTVTGKVTIKDGNGNVVPSEDADGSPGPIHDTTVIVREKNGKDINGEGTRVEVPVNPETGEFEKELPEGEYIVEVNVPDGYAKPKPGRVEVKPGTKPTVPPFEVKPTERNLRDNSYREVGGTVSGYLVDEKNYPIRDGKVVLIGKNAVNPDTGEVFDYEVPLTVDEDGYFITPDIDFKYFPDGEAEFDYEVHLPEGWPTTDKDGNPLTDANGNPLFDKDGNPLRVPAIDKETGSKVVTPDTPLRIPPVRIPAPTDQSIKGSVNDGNGNSVPGTVVVVTDPRGDSHVVETDKNGDYEVDNLVPGVHEVEVITPDGKRRKDKIVVPIRPGEEVELPEIQVTPATMDLKKRVFGRDADHDGYAKDENGNVIHDGNGDPVEDVMTVGVGEELFYTFIITNTSDQDITGIDASSVDDPLLGDNEIQMPENWTAESVLAPNKSVVFSAKMTAPDAYDFNNVATVKGKTKDGKPVGSNADGAYTKFMALEAEKKVNARFASNPDKPVSVAADEALNFTYEIVNSGSAPMVNVKVTDTVYEGNEEDFKGADGKLNVDPEKLGEGTPLKVKAPEGFNGTLLPGQRVVFTAEIPEGLKPGRRHFNAAEARGELPKRPARGRNIEGEPDYGEDPASVLIVSPRSNLKGNAHIVVSEGAALANDVTSVLWLDKNDNGKQDPGEGLAGVEVLLKPTDGSPAIKAETNEDGNVLFENAPYGEYTMQVVNPGGMRLVDPKDPDKNSFEEGSILESKPFTVDKDERFIDLRMETPRGTDSTATTTVTEVQEANGSADLGKCLATASSLSNPVAWLVPIGLLGAVMGGIGVMFEDELNEASAQANAALRQIMPNANFGIERPQWMNDIQAEVDRVNRQLAEINPAAPAAAGGVALLAIVGLLTGLYYASCQAGWNEPTEGSSSEGSSKKADGEATETEGTEEKSSSARAEEIFGSSKKAEDTESEAVETETAPVVETSVEDSADAQPEAKPEEAAN